MAVNGATDSISVSSTVSVGSVPLPVAVQDPRPVFADMRLSEFSGREWLIDQVDRFLTDHPCGFLILQADTGLGKTTVAAHLVQQRGYLSHFTHLGGRSVSAALRNLAAQLITRCGLEEMAPEGVVPEWAHTTDGLTALLTHAAKKVTAAGDRIVLVVDGLDEAEPAGTGLPLGLPTLLPDGVFVIATRRPGTTVSLESPTLWLPITPDQAENTIDIHRFLTRTIREPTLATRLAEAGVSAEEFAATLARRCGGVWLYLRYLLDEIRLGHRAITDLDDLPQNLDEYYTQALRADRDKHQWEQVGLPVWATLAAAHEPLTLDALTRLSGTLAPQTVQRLCASTHRPLLAVTDTQPRRYAICHPSLREYLTDRFPHAVREAHSRIADHYLTCFGGLHHHLSTLAADPDLARQDDGYPLRHLATHLAHAGRIDDLHALLTCEHPTGTGQAYNVWHRAHNHAGTLHNYLADITRAQAYARAATDRYLATGQVTPHLGLELLYTLITASPTNGSNRAKALTDLDPRLSPGDRRDACHTTVNDGSARVRVLASLAEHLPPDDRRATLHQALHTATTITDPYDRADALTYLAPHLPPHQRRTVLHQARHAAAAVPDPYDRALILASLAEHLPPDDRRATLHQALHTATTIVSDSDRAWAITDLTKRLPADLLPHALKAATTIANNYDRARVLKNLLTRFPPQELATRIHQASRTTTFGTSGEDLFTFCVEMLPHDPRGLTTIARALTPGAPRATVLAFLATAAPLINQYGGVSAIRYCLDAVNTVCRWWP